MQELCLACSFNRRCFALGVHSMLRKATLMQSNHAESTSCAQGSRGRESTSTALNAVTMTSSATRTLTHVRISYVRSSQPSIMHCTKTSGPCTRYYRADFPLNIEHSVPSILDCLAPDGLYQMPCLVHSKKCPELYISAVLDMLCHLYKHISQDLSKSLAQIVTCVAWSVTRKWNS